MQACVSLCKHFRTLEPFIFCILYSVFCILYSASLPLPSLFIHIFSFNACLHRSSILVFYIILAQNYLKKAEIEHQYSCLIFFSCAFSFPPDSHHSFLLTGSTFNINLFQNNFFSFLKIVFPVFLLKKEEETFFMIFSPKSNFLWLCFFSVKNFSFLF